jgi:putative ABC transport system permease protein
MTALLALAGSGPLGVLIAVLALGVRSVIARRKDALALASARGASSAQLRGVMLLEGLVIAVPGSILAVVVAVLAVPARVGPESLVLPIVVAAAVPVLFVATTPGRGLRASRADLAAGSRSTRRWVLEVIVVALAALALYLLARRGLLDSSAEVGVDPLLAATPLLLSLAACVIVLRLYPLPLLALQRRLRRSRGAVGMIGSARAVRDPTAGFASVLAMVAGVSAALFSLVMATTLSAGLLSTAQHDVGADIRVEALQLRPDLVDSIVALPGVTTSAALSIAPDVTMAAGYSELHAGVVFVDAAALHAVRPDLPQLEVGGDEVHYLASAGVTDRIPDGSSALDSVPATSSGTIDDMALPGLGGTWVIVDASEQARILGTELIPSQLLLTTGAGVDRAALATSIRDLVVKAQPAGDADRVSVTDVASTVAAAEARPTTRGLTVALMLAAALSLVLSAIAIIVGSYAATAARNRILGVLRMLGMSPRQARGLVAWELAPVAITAVVAGTALGLALTFIVTSVLDLRAFVGGTATVSPVVTPWLVAAVAVGFAAIAACSGLIAIVVARRTNPAQTVKMGSA